MTSIILGIAAQQSLGNVFSGLVLLLSHCTASELDAGSVSCGLADPAGWGKIAVRVCPPAVLDHDPASSGGWPSWDAARRPRRSEIMVLRHEVMVLRGQDRVVGPVHPGPGLGPAEYLDFMAQDGDLGVLGC